jgi:hypothetical protein
VHHCSHEQLGVIRLLMRFRVNQFCSQPVKPAVKLVSMAHLRAIRGTLLSGSGGKKSISVVLFDLTTAGAGLGGLRAAGRTIAQAALVRRLAVTLDGRAHSCLPYDRDARGDSSARARLEL